MNIPQIIISVVLLAILCGAIYQFIATPASKRWSNPPEKKSGVEYAPMYTKNEKVRLFTVHALWLIPTIIILQFLIFPKYREFCAHAECYQFGAINGVQVVFYFLFVGLPLLLAVAIFFGGGLQALRAMRAGQFPPPNEKVLHLTAYKYGAAAKFAALPPIIFVVFFLGMGLWGGYQTNILTKEIKPCLQPQAASTLFNHITISTPASAGVKSKDIL